MGLTPKGFWSRRRPGRGAEARRHTGRAASVHLHLDARLPPPLWSKTKTHKQVQTADCMILGILLFLFPSPLARSVPPALRHGRRGKAGSASQGTAPGHEQKRSSQSSRRPRRTGQQRRLAQTGLPGKGTDQPVCSWLGTGQRKARTVRFQTVP